MRSKLIGKTKVRSVISFFVTLFLSVFLTLLVLLSLFWFSAFRQSNVLSCMQKSNWYKAGYEQVIDDLDSSIKNTDIPLEVITDVLTYNRYYIDQQNYVKSTFYEKKQNSQPAQTIGIKQAILTYYEKQNQILSDEMIENIDLLSDFVMERYTNWIENPWMKQMQSYKEEIKPFVIKGILCSSIVILLLSISLLNSYRHKYRAVRYLSFATLGASLTMLLIHLYLSYGYSIKHLLTGPYYYQQFNQVYIESLAMTVLAGALGLGMIYIILLILVYIGKHYGSRDKLNATTH